MPNFWSKAGQFISEKISGSRTKDNDIATACEKMKNTEKGLLSLKFVLQNFLSYYEKFSKYFTDINTALKLIYEDSPFYNFTEEITCKHQIIKSEFEEMNKKLKNILAKTTEWNIIFNSAKEQIKIREEKRKVYDHYESKISKINKNSNKKDLKFIERNESKFSKAASEYVDISEKTYNIINNSLKLTWELTNPIVDEIITAEKILFEGISKSLSCFKNNSERFLEIKHSLDNPIINNNNFSYDPMKYMGEKNLMKKISLNRSMTPYLLPNKKINNLSGEDFEKKIAIFKKSNENKNSDNLYKIFINENKLNEFNLIQDEFY
jgi:hypothetical protein